MTYSIDIGNRAIGWNEPAFIIAESGVHYNRDLETSLKLIEAAAEAGADAIKFQSFHTEMLISKELGETHFITNEVPGENAFEKFKSLELSVDDHCKLKSHCVEKGIMFLSSPFDRKSVDDLDSMGTPMFKMGSGEVTNLPLLKHVAKKGKPIILSTGMSYLGEVDQAVGAMRREGCHRLILLHCISSYPADPGEMNLRAMETLSSALRLPVGLSDHSPGTEVALAAVALGACVIEKHISLSTDDPSYGNGASLLPDEFATMVRRIRSVEQALGDGIKKPYISELDRKDEARRSLALARDMKAGDTLSSKDLICLRPAKGINPTFEQQVLGKSLRKNLKAGTFLDWGHLE